MILSVGSKAQPAIQFIGMTEQCNMRLDLFSKTASIRDCGKTFVNVIRGVFKSACRYFLNLLVLFCLYFQRCAFDD
jgi:hypothetical protein